MALVWLLIAVPLITALLLLIFRNEKARGGITVLGAVATAVLSIAFTGFTFQSGVISSGTALTLGVSQDLSYTISCGMTVVDILLCAVILWNAAKYKNRVALVLGFIQTVGTLLFAQLALSGGAHHMMETPFRSDALTVIMVLIVGLVGSAICVYALGYMQDFQHHQPADSTDRRHVFAALMFTFLAAMFVIVLSDNLEWMFTGWEITTVCSFLMIGFTRTDEAIKNSFRQINLNMIGGLAFLGALIVLAAVGIELSLSNVIKIGQSSAAWVMIIPVMLFALAGLTKAAQMPFQSWLLGAMVAPTPTSALLHSSTMVKAGIFLLIRLAPIFRVLPAASVMVVFIGGITFVLCSFMAITQSNAKRVLAYSTIANLGLMSACAGVGTTEATWAAIFLMIFHTVSKSTLFLCVGSVEHRIGSRDIEDMDGLYNRLPHLTRFMMLGIMGMFVAPFGMLISKWATLVSFAETGNVLFLIMLAFGSAATFFYWAKWLGKLTGVMNKAQNQEAGVHRSEWAAIGFISALFIACCVCLPLMSQAVVTPYLEATFLKAPRFIEIDNMLIMVVSAVFIAIVLFTPLGVVRGKRAVKVYLSGAAIDADERRYIGSMGHAMQSTKRNWYLTDIFSEKLLSRIGMILSIMLMVITFIASWILDLSVLTGGGMMVEKTVELVGPNLLGILIGVVIFGVAAPVIGCLLDGLDRKVSAGMQGRVGPRLLQPYYDLRKLLVKEQASVNSVDEAYVICGLIFSILAGGVFISGSNLLMCIFLVTLGTLFIVMAGYSSRSPYSDTGADRECLQVMSYEPMLIIMSVGFFITTGSFDVASLTMLKTPLIASLVPIFLGLLFILTIKLRKSPFDLSYSHHAHQELLKGITSEMSGRTLALLDVMHWCESVLFLMWAGMFFVWDNPASIALALAVVALIWFFEVWIDNNFARVKWQLCLKLAWLVALIVGIVNLFHLLITPLL